LETKGAPKVSKLENAAGPPEAGGILKEERME
jgi:hypothetical protein